ncbi:alpha/beta hydrolase [Desulfallas sp. Bu1-1]|uniref:alpha/beta fold hydrolase n=1 Tax=Desulfallas sp. Bu1-1 TaxID=2787620 RepID=UPI00189D34CF|nr:alpha/beta hydrolase [Desulfallas sp. Bu1-1]MBF7083657.1 alpha/beta hydrolase [Desulfallas sp. Bu1-1]
MPLVEIDGNMVFYQENGGKEQELPALILLHGAGGTSARWEHLLGALSGVSRCIAPDLPGHGKSGGSPCQTIEEYTTFIKKFCDSLGLKHFFLCGHSMGGAIAIEYALRHPFDLKGLILANTGAKLRVSPDFLAMLSNGVVPGRNFSDGSNYDGDETSGSVYLNDFKACDRFNRMEQVSEIGVPTLVICGLEDKNTPLKYSQYLQNKIAGAKLCVIPEAGHMTMLEQPGKFSACVIGFIKKLM